MDQTNLTRRRMLKGTTAAGLAGLAGCSGNGGNGGDGGSNSTPKPTSSGSGGGGKGTTAPPKSMATKLAIAHWPTIPFTVPVHVAREKNMFEQNGVDITDIVSFSGGGTTVRGIVTGGLGIGQTALPALVQAYVSGAPIYLVGMVLQQPDIDFEVLPDSDIESIQDCKGKTIAVSNPGSSSEALTIRSVQQAKGITLDDVEIMYAGGLGESITAMNEGKADVTWNIPPKSTVMLQKNQSRRVWFARDYASNVTEGVLAIGGVTLDEKPEMARAILQTYVDAYDFVRNNQEESGRIWAEAVDLPEEVAVPAFKSVDPKNSYQIQLTEEVLKTTAKTMIAQDLIDEQPPWKKIANQSLLPEDKQLDWLK